MSILKSRLAGQQTLEHYLYYRICNLFMCIFQRYRITNHLTTKYKTDHAASKNLCCQGYISTTQFSCLHFSFKVASQETKYSLHKTGSERGQLCIMNQFR